MNKKQKKVLTRILVTAVCMVILRFLNIPQFADFIAYLVLYLIIGYDILLRAFKGIKSKQVFDENFLMAIATVGAFIIGAVKTGDYVEAIAVMLFYQIGELFQSYAVGKSRRNISELMDIRPDYANIEENGTLTKVDPDDVEVGTEIIVQPGEKIPIDGTVVSGKSTLNTSALTGESIPKDVEVGDEVYSGAINLNGLLHIRTTKEFGDSTASKILDLVESAGFAKSKSENFISRFAKVYTPFVCYSALALAVLPPIVNVLFLHNGANVGEWVYRALLFLVMSCPCALVISIPLTFFASLGGASKAGVLVKGSNYIEALSKANTVAFDKTGTLTNGEFVVVEVNPLADSAYTEEQLLENAALAESASSHPISKSIRKAYAKDIDRRRVSDIKEISGNGITAAVDGKTVTVGNYKLMLESVSDTSTVKENHTVVGTVVYVAVDNQFVGDIVIADTLKKNAVKAVKSLKSAGVSNVVMLTGDTQRIAEKIGSDLGITNVYSELLPQDKVEKVQELIQKNKGGNVVFVGDGINDAPVLTRADIGIAMGAMGSDAAIEAADVVLMDDDPLKITEAIRISKKCMRIVYENIVIAIGVKSICLILGALGIANMWYAIFADVGVMVIAVINAIRALIVHKTNE